MVGHPPGLGGTPQSRTAHPCHGAQRAITLGTPVVVLIDRVASFVAVQAACTEKESVLRGSSHVHVYKGRRYSAAPAVRRYGLISSAGAEARALATKRRPRGHIPGPRPLRPRRHASRFSYVNRGTVDGTEADTPGCGTDDSYSGEPASWRATSWRVRARNASIDALAGRGGGGGGATAARQRQLLRAVIAARRSRSPPSMPTSARALRPWRRWSAG